MIVIKILSIIAFIGSVLWTIADPGYEPALAMIASLTAFITNFICEKRKDTAYTQRQKVSGQGFGIQAGGDVNLGNTQPSKKRKR